MNKKSVLYGLTDEEVLKEFVKHFKVDGAVLFYKEGNNGFSFTRWRNKEGGKFCRQIIKATGYVERPKTSDRG